MREFKVDRNSTKADWAKDVIESWWAIMVITVSYNLSEIEMDHSAWSRERSRAAEHLMFVVKLFQKLSHPLEVEKIGLPIT